MSNDIPQTSTSPLKFTVPLTAVVHAGLLRAAEAKCMEPTEIIQRALIANLIKDGHIADDDAERIKLFWRLVDQAVAEAQAICRAGAFKPSITLDAIHTCMRDPEWVEGYKTFVGDDIFKSGNPKKGQINREIGFRIRSGIKGVVALTPEKKPQIVKVLGEIIQSYTPMADYDRQAFASDASDKDDAEKRKS